MKCSGASFAKTTDLILMKWENEGLLCKFWNLIWINQQLEGLSGNLVKVEEGAGSIITASFPSADVNPTRTSNPKIFKRRIALLPGGRKNPNRDREGDSEFEDVVAGGTADVRLLENRNGKEG